MGKKPLIQLQRGRKSFSHRHKVKLQHSFWLFGNKTKFLPVIHIRIKLDTTTRCPHRFYIFWHVIFSGKSPSLHKAEEVVLSGKHKRRCSVVSRRGKVFDSVRVSFFVKCSGSRGAPQNISYHGHVMNLPEHLIWCDLRMLDVTLAFMLKRMFNTLLKIQTSQFIHLKTFIVVVHFIAARGHITTFGKRFGVSRRYKVYGPVSSFLIV